MGERVMSLLEFLYHQPTAEEQEGESEDPKFNNKKIALWCHYTSNLLLWLVIEREDCSSDRRESDWSGGSGGLVLSRCEV